MITVADGRSLKKPSRIQLRDEKLNRVFDFDYKKMIKGLTNQATRQGLMDYVFYRGPAHAVMITLDDTQHGVLLHTSISRTDSDPTWETIKALKALVFGDTDVMMVLPKAELYVNVHEHCFHMWQMPTDWGIG